MCKNRDILKPWILVALAGALLITAPVALQAADKTIVVVEKSSDPKHKTNHTKNCQNLPANSTKVEAGTLQEAVTNVNGALGKDDCVKNLHFRGHGSPGNQSVGDGVKHQAGKRINGNQADWKAKLKSIKFCKDATIHLWGCRVGEGEKGACKLKDIATCTGATVRGAVNKVRAGKQETYDGPICEAKPGEGKPTCEDAAEEKAPKKDKESDDVGCVSPVSRADAISFGARDNILNTEDVGCDGIPWTFDRGEGDGILNLAGGGENGCPSGPGEDLGCDNTAGTFDAGEGDGILNSEDHDGDRALTVYDATPTPIDRPNRIE